jgi:hypothetical protein
MSRDCDLFNRGSNFFKLAQPFQFSLSTPEANGIIPAKNSRHPTCRLAFNFAFIMVFNEDYHSSRSTFQIVLLLFLLLHVLKVFRS